MDAQSLPMTVLNKVADAIEFVPFLIGWIIRKTLLLAMLAVLTLIGLTVLWGFIQTIRVLWEARP